MTDTYPNGLPVLPDKHFWRLTERHSLGQDRVEIELCKRYWYGGSVALWDSWATVGKTDEPYRDYVLRRAMELFEEFEKDRAHGDEFSGIQDLLGDTP